MIRFAALLLFGLLAIAPARANGIDRMYTPDTLSEWQVRIGAFIQGVYGDIIKPGLTEDEQRRLPISASTFRRPPRGRSRWRSGGPTTRCICPLHR